METRKIIRFGKNSYVISIPKNWVTENKLRKGDSVYIDEMTTDLRIMPAEKTKSTEISKIVIETDNKDLEYIKHEIVSAYLMNYNIIELIGQNISQNVSDIKTILRDLSGLEIMDLTARRITAHDILNEEDVDLQNILRRVDMIVRSMISDSIKTVESDLYENIYARDADVNRLVFLAQRVLRKAISDAQMARAMNMTFPDMMNYWNTISNMEGIADQAKRAARHLKNIQIDDKSRKELESLYSSIYHIYLEIMKAYYTKDKGLAFRMMEQCTKRNVDCDKFMENQQSVDVAHAIGFIKSMNSLIKHIARIVSIM